MEGVGDPPPQSPSLGKGGEEWKRGFASLRLSFIFAGL